jgi:phosphatidylserine/phosphatidylglycerophosphate/cardiolipin synthase-like enzyme
VPAPAVVRSEPLSYFADLAKAFERSLIRMYLVSPWIVLHESREFPALARALSAVRQSGARLTTVTRTPVEASHARAVDLIAAIPEAEIVFLDSLHAKLYLLDCNGARIAMVGSPNFTPQGDHQHRELAVLVRSSRDSDAASLLARDLFDFALELMSDPSAKIHKRPRFTGRPLQSPR